MDQKFIDVGRNLALAKKNWLSESLQGENTSDVYTLLFVHNNMWSALFKSLLLKVRN